MGWESLGLVRIYLACRGYAGNKYDNVGGIAGRRSACGAGE